MKREWTELDFDNMSWHDNSVHGLNIVEGEHGAGELILHIDHIVEWLSDGSGNFQFQILPATLVFHETTGLRINIDYAKASAGLTPFQIDQILCECVPRASGYVSKLWTIKINWPVGEITFESPGFSQYAVGLPVQSKAQTLTNMQRNTQKIQATQQE